MQEQITEVLHYLYGVIKYKWLAIVLAWIICLCGWLIVAALPNKYTSQARVHVETRTMLEPLLAGMTIKTDVEGLLRVMQRLMFTKTNLEQIVKLSELSKTTLSPIDEVKLFESLKKEIKINGGADEIYTIEYESTNPDLAKNVVQAVLTVFSEQTQMHTLQGADVAHHFIEEQIKEYELRLKNGEKARENFKRANLTLLAGQGGGDQIGQIQQINKVLEDEKLALKEATSKKEALKKQLDEVLNSDDDDWGILENVPSTPDDARITDLSQKRDELLIKYTKNHPSVAYIEKTIKELKKQNAEKQAKLTEGGNIDSEVLANPYIQSIKVALNETDVNIASINSRIEIFQQRLAKAQDELNARLSVETEMANLNRDYDTIRANYGKLLQSKEQAYMSEKVDNQSEALKFKIADAPNTPLEPSSPNRKLLYSVVLLTGIAVGLGVATLIFMLRPTIVTMSQLRQLTGLPILGAVSLKINPDIMKKNKMDIIRFCFSVLGLVVIYIGFMTINVSAFKLPALTDYLQRFH